MGLFSRIAGVVASFFQVGGPGGPGLNANGAALEARNSTNAAFATFRGGLIGATPGNNDLVPLGSMVVWPETFSPTVSFTAHTTDVGCSNIVLTAQGPFATATGTNRIPGAFQFVIPVPTNGGTTESAGVQVLRGGTVIAALGPVAFGASSGLLTLGNSTFQGTPGGSPNLVLVVAGTNIAQFKTTSASFFVPLQGGSASTPISLAPASIAMSTGNIPVTAQQNYLKLTGSLTGDNVLQIPAVDGATTYIDATQITFNAHKITIQANGNNLGTTFTAPGIMQVFYNSASGKLWSVTLTS